MIGTLHPTRYLPHANPRAVHDPFAPDTFMEDYRGHRIIVELVSSEFVKARVLSPTGRPLAEMSSAATVEASLSAAKMLVDETVEGME